MPSSPVPGQEKPRDTIVVTKTVSVVEFDEAVTSPDKLEKPNDNNRSLMVIIVAAIVGVLLLVIIVMIVRVILNKSKITQIPRHEITGDDKTGNHLKVEP